MTWTKDDLRRLDNKYAKEGVPLHQRAFKASVEILGSSFRLGIGGNTEVQEIWDAYNALFPEGRESWPGTGIGFISSSDRVRKVTSPVSYVRRQTFEVWRSLGFESAEQWWQWCREDKDIAAGTHFAYADISDFSLGRSDLQGRITDAQTLWGMAESNLSDIANILPTTYSLASVIQPICLVAELSLKAALVFNGTDPDEWHKRKAKENGHDVVALGKRIAQELPHRDDELVARVLAQLPPYVPTRYVPAGLTRLQVVKLALGVQFVAASTVRRLSDRDLAIQMESSGWPAPRRI